VNGNREQSGEFYEAVLKERPESALLTHETWLDDIFSDEFTVTDEWLASMNALLVVANEKMDGRDKSTIQSIRIKQARTEVFSAFAQEAKTEDLARVFMSYGSRLRPGVIIESASYLASIGLRVEDIFVRAPNVFQFGPEALQTRMSANIQHYGEQRSIELAQQKPRVFLGNSSRHNDLKISAALKLGAVLEPGYDIRENLGLMPNLFGGSLSKVFAIARLAAEFHEDVDVSPARVNTVLAQPLDSHMLTLLEDGTYNTKRVQHYRESVPAEERRTRVLRLLSTNTHKFLGGSILRSYFNASPLSDLEVRAFPVLARHSASHFRDYDPEQCHEGGLINDANSSAIAMAIAEPEKLNDSEWVSRMNFLIRKGSLSARRYTNQPKANNPITRARKNFLEEMGWLDESHPMFSKVNTYLKRRPGGLPTAHIIRALSFAYDNELPYATFLRRFPQLVPTDLVSMEVRKQSLLSIFEEAGRASASKLLLAKFAGYFVLSEAGLAELKVITAQYKQNLGANLTDTQLRYILRSTPEMHALVFESHEHPDPKTAYFYAKELSHAEVRQRLAKLKQEKESQN